MRGAHFRPARPLEPYIPGLPSKKSRAKRDPLVPPSPEELLQLLAETNAGLGARAGRRVELQNDLAR